MRTLFLATLLLGTPALSSMALAADAKAGPGEVELAALYYYAEQKQQDRLEAETDRRHFRHARFPRGGFCCA